MVAEATAGCTTDAAMAALSTMLEAPPDGDAAAPVAFEEFTRPWCRVAAAALERRHSEALGRELAPAARRALQRPLRVRLSDALSLALFGEFTAFRSERSTPWDRLVGASAATDDRRLYDQFVAWAAAGVLPDILDHYPVAARIAATLTEQWVEATCELVMRLACDRDALTAAFGDGRPLGPVVDAASGLSDPHHGGRTVAVLRFASGLRLVYKPKDLGTEWAFGRLLDWLDATGELEVRLRAPAVLCREGYGWAEHVERRDCADEEALGRYYRRAGMLACLVYCLAGSDCHRENVVAHGEYPVLVDVECLMGHRPATMPDRPGVHQIALDELRSGVLGTGLLPSWQVDDEDGTGGPRDISGLHVPGPDELVETARRWEHVNTDAMALRTGPVRVEATEHVPAVLGREPHRALMEHADDLLEGFSSCYRALVARRDELLAPDGPIAGIARRPVRFLFRNTRVYGALHHRLLHPRFLSSEAARDEELQRLRQGLDTELLTQRWAALVDSEIEALDRCDVPHFTALPDSETLTLDDGTDVGGCLREPSHRLVVDRIRGLGEADLAQQLGFIAGSLHAEAARRADAPGDVPAHGQGAGRKCRGRSLTDAALAIARDLIERAVRSDGAATWIAPQYLPRLERYQLQPVGYDLHSGGCGPAVFLASVAALTDDAPAATLAREALRPLQDAFARSAYDVRRAVGPGGATGLGSLVYGLVRCAALLDDDDLLDTAAQAARLVDDQHLDGAELDVFSGVAGDLLGLLALHEATGDGDVLTRAAWCGDRLVAAARPAASGRTWNTLGTRTLTGFSHGVAGIAYALARLSAATGSDAHAAAARDGVRYEDSLFDPTVGNWPDLREEVQPAYKVNWCHGAPGIGLARLGAWQHLPDAALLADVDRAVATTLAVDLDGPDHLCCGNLGRADLLLAAGTALARPDLLAAARERAETVVNRADDGVYRLHSSLPRRVHMPGFFMGLSGVGYALLRTEHPDVLGSVLLWR